MKPSAILVTGGTGMVGRSMVRALADAGHTVRMISRRANLKVPANVVVHRGDIARAPDVRAALQGCAAVFHCAAEKTDSAQMALVNETATRILFTMARDSGVAFFCHLSSVGVSGQTDAKVVDEETPCHPMNVYEETKLAAERIVSEGLEAGRVVILRPTNIFDSDSIRPWFSDSITSRVRLLLKGRERSHLVYVEDVTAAAMHLYSTASAGRPEAYVVSSDEESGNTHREVKAYLAAQMNRAPRLLTISAPLFVPYYARRLKHGRTNRGDVVYSSQKLRSTGFEFPYGLRKGLNAVINLSSTQEGQQVAL